MTSCHDVYTSGSGFLSHCASSDAGASTRYGGIDISAFAFLSMHAHAVSPSRCSPGIELHDGVAHSAGQPAHADAMILGSGGDGGESPTNVTPCGSPGVAAGGPTVPGATEAGSLPFGISSLGGRIARVHHATTAQF